MESWGQGEEVTFIKWLGTGRWVKGRDFSPEHVRAGQVHDDFVRARRIDYLRKYIDSLSIRAHWENLGQDACRRVAENLLASLLTAA